jgi:hypothetical protein
MTKIDKLAAKWVEEASTIEGRSSPESAYSAGFWAAKQHIARLMRDHIPEPHFEMLHFISIMTYGDQEED